jgi:hypothetical protein
MTRAELLRVGPQDISPAAQADGARSFESAIAKVETALEGGTPVFEWLHRDVEGREIPCEVRLVRLPSSSGNLIRASIIDITDRKRADHIAAGERRVFERIAANASLSSSLRAITDLIEQVVPHSICCIRIAAC